LQVRSARDVPAFIRTIEIVENGFIFMSDLLPALRGRGSPAPYRRFIGSPHLFVCICHLGVVRGAELPQEPIIPGSKALF